MSLLYRTGNGRNNIAWGGSTSTAATYLRRISTGRNDINYISISSNGTYNILNRTSTGRNNISWINTTFSFKSGLQLYPLRSNYSSVYNFTYNVYYVDQISTDYGSRYLYMEPLSNGYRTTSQYSFYNRGSGNVYTYIYSDYAQQIYNHIKSNFSKITISFATGETGTNTLAIDGKKFEDIFKVSNAGKLLSIYTIWYLRSDNLSMENYRLGTYMTTMIFS